MPTGFFQGSVVASSKAPLPVVAQCGSCGLYKTCNSPKMAPSGQGRRKVLIVAEAPGADEDKQGIQLVGKSGTLLNTTLARLDVEMRKDCWLTNAIICRPPNNETPDANKINYCRPNLFDTIKRFDPEVIIPLGGVAVHSLLAPLFKENVGAMTRWVGWQIPCQSLNAWICPTYHPSYLERTKDKVLELFFKRNLEAAFQLERRPWNKVPDFKSQVEPIFKGSAAAKAIRDIIAAGKPAAFDYETNQLKPDDPDSIIVCCSVSNGKRTIAFPWAGEAIEAMREFVRSPLGKIASNMKFEERWTMAKLGCRTRNWVWDTMLNAHVLDNREDITSIKFQAFVLFGQAIYNSHIEPFLRAKGGQKVNRVLKEIDLRQLLEYCGLDSLLEYKVARTQSELAGLKF